MKWPHRDFVVEIKSSRRAPKSKSSSIWGSLDLKAHAAEVENELRQQDYGAAIPNRIKTPSEPDIENTDRLPNSNMTPRGEMVIGVSSEALDPAVASTQNLTIVDEMPKTRADVKSPPQKLSDRQRVDSESQTAGPKATNNIASHVLKSVGRRKHRLRKNPGTVSIDTKTSYDLGKDLNKLEAENKRLKKLLADKLYNENAELKRKLGFL
ncbi:hypothetical protein ABFT80_23360 [Mesorhizobium sp. SB112]|uniref:hypothetical protein n=1 Tax=Mesorhizobium sp. SB112 TaxID=3151853 RepID=UPI003265C945